MQGTIKRFDSELQRVENELSNVEDDRDDFDRDYSELHIFTPQRFADFIARRTATEFGRVWSKYCELVFRINAYYIECSEEERIVLRGLVHSRPTIRAYLYPLAEELFWRLRFSGNAQFLKDLLVIISIDDSGPGGGGAWRFLLADVFQIGKQMGLDVRAALLEIADISNEAPHGLECQESTKHFFSVFEP